MKNLKHLISIQEAAQELHKLMLGVPWYIRTAVETMPPDPKAPTTSKQEKKEIIVFVRDLSLTENQPATFNSWPVRYKLGA